MRQSFIFALLLLSASARSQITDSITMPKDGLFPAQYSVDAAVSNDKTRTDYVEKYKTISVGEMERTGIPASITLAQGLLESAAGTSQLALEANNHFGIKCGSDWDGRRFEKQDDDRDSQGNLIKSCFRKYSTAEHSFFDHSEFLRDPKKYNRYGFLFNLDRQDYKGWAQGLQASGYATSGDYASRLINLIERYRLYEYDRPEAQPGPPMLGDAKRRIGRVNDVKVVISRSGETLDDIAHIYRLRTDKVVDYNDYAFAPGVRLPANTRVYIQAKKSKWHGRSTHHLVRENQTMLEISQLYGVCYDNLLKRNGLQRGQEPAMGENVRLRGRYKSSEQIRLRPANETTSPTGTQTSAARPPTPQDKNKMTTDNNELFDLGPAENKPVQPAKPQPQPEPVKPAPPANTKPATSGVPYPTDPTPSSKWPAPSPSPTPSYPSPTSPQVPVQPSAKPNIPGAVYHNVVKGDTLFSLARRYETTPARIKQLNDMTNDTVKIGESLRVR